LAIVRIAIVGVGKMGTGFAAALAGSHDVLLGSRDPKKASAAAARTGVVAADSYAEAAAGADVVFLTVPGTAMDDTIARLGPVDSVVVDPSSPYSRAEREALKGRSVAELVQTRLPNARVVKAWNHVFARYLTDAEVSGVASSVLIAGDDAAAKRTVSRLARDMRFHPVDVGPLKAARDLEALAGTMLFVKLGRFRVLTDG
jgi:8-hydroxy-5-deazaflavin:NADPH oxidoreductase